MNRIIYRAFRDYQNNFFLIKTSFVSLKGLKALANKSGNKSFILSLIFVENCLKLNVLSEFTV